MVNLHRFPALVRGPQIAAPDRGAPDHGTVDYPAVFAEIAALGWTRPLGAEYKPGGDTDNSLAWMTRF